MNRKLEGEFDDWTFDIHVDASSFDNGDNSFLNIEVSGQLIYNGMDEVLVACGQITIPIGPGEENVLCMGFTQWSLGPTYRIVEIRRGRTLKTRSPVGDELHLTLLWGDPTIREMEIEPNVGQPGMKIQTAIAQQSHTRVLPATLIPHFVKWTSASWNSVSQ